MSLRGQVQFQADGQAMALRFSTNAMCNLEAESGSDLMSFFGKFDSGRVSFTDVRLAVKCGLEGPERTKEEVGDIIDDVGLAEMIKLLTAAIMAAMPAVEKGEVAKPGNGRRRA